MIFLARKVCGSVWSPSGTAHDDVDVDDDDDDDEDEDEDEYEDDKFLMGLPWSASRIEQKQGPEKD